MQTFRPRHGRRVSIFRETEAENERRSHQRQNEQGQESEFNHSHGMRYSVVERCCQPQPKTTEAEGELSEIVATD